MMRVLLWGNLMGWTGITAWTVTARPLFVVPCALLAAANLAALFPDVLADHPEEQPFTEVDRQRSIETLRQVSEEGRRRRGAAGWEKPVRPSQQPRPGGLPPRRGA